MFLQNLTPGVSPSGYKYVGDANAGYQETPLRAIDGPCGNFRDSKATEASAGKAAAMGFDGEQVIPILARSK